VARKRPHRFSNTTDAFFLDNEYPKELTKLAQKWVKYKL
jgi:hypothetical protein